MKRFALKTVLLAVPLAIAVTLAAQTLYRYKDSNGDWHFSDRPPEDQREVATQRMSGNQSLPDVTVEQSDSENGTQLTAVNEWHCPVELVITFTEIKNIDPSFKKPFRTVLPPNSSTDLFEIVPVTVPGTYGFEMEYAWLQGDPQNNHDAGHLYMMPYARGTEYQVTQAFPSSVTHDDAASRHAIDFAMPEGTPVYAARAGTVISAEYGNFTGGTDKSNLPKANAVRIAHDDGTIATYAHLSWNAIRVRAGQRVTRGQYIADSGNTGFSSGPHLHFVVMENIGMKFTSVPILFEGAGGRAVTPMTGQTLVNVE